MDIRSVSGLLMASSRDSSCFAEPSATLFSSRGIQTKKTSSKELAKLIMSEATPYNSEFGISEFTILKLYVNFTFQNHDHQLTLLPRLDSFTCNACGLKGDRSPYACFDCGFMVHQDCLALPRVININRRDHRVSHTSVLGDGAMNSVCGVVIRRKDVWNGKELEGVPEEEEDTEPYVVIDENTIQHFSHKEHYLRFNENGVLYEDNKRCSACTHPIGLQSFYGFTNKELEVFDCYACKRKSNGFMYKHGKKKLDVMCGSISEPFTHPSHPHHPLYYSLIEKEELCNGCNGREYFILKCIEGDCGFVLGFTCATLPQVVNHRVEDHPLSLCYGEEEEASVCARRLFRVHAKKRSNVLDQIV
ncbi:hypothetical protein F2Q69_00039528 [Brassica cretica]|uniref:DC1 domain-containing protein n=1 Tax=Brassica cretica TaxID=69181 RepID=A0A8S9NLR5_BRACR|nr:hypothetical protein F2Q69_00039528 [Brassica cretica]